MKIRVLVADRMRKAAIIGDSDNDESMNIQMSP